MEGIEVIDEFKVREMAGIQRDKDHKILAVEKEADVSVGIGPFEIYLSVDQARKLARMLNRLARRVEARNT